MNTCNMLGWQMKCVFGQNLWNTVWWWWMHSASSLQLKKDCWNSRRRLQTYLSNRDLIHAYTESHCGINISLSLSLHSSTVLGLHCLCNHALSPSDEKLITIHLYQKEPSLHSRHRLDCCVYNLLLRTHLKREDSLMLFILGVWTRLLFRQQWWYFLLSDNLLQCYLTDCLSDSTGQGKY